MRRTLLDVRLSRIPQAIGSCREGNIDLIGTVNEAQQRLLTDELQPDEGWWGTWAILAFTISRANPFFTTPRGVARVTAVDVCKKPVLLRNQFYEYLDFGNGIRPSNSCSGNPLCENLTAFDRGPVPTFVAPSPPNKFLRVYATDETDFGKRVLFGIKDKFGNIVYSQDGFDRVTGEFVVLTSPFVNSVNKFSELFGIQKDLTNGQIQIYEVDTVSGDQTLLSTMEPGETTACYRRYFVNGLPNSCCGQTPSPDDTTPISVSALVKLEFIPVVVDTDYLIIGNLAALKEECQSVRFGEMDSPEAKNMAAMHHGNAIKLLMGELDHYVGKTRVSIQVPIWGSDRIPAMPV